MAWASRSVSDARADTTGTMWEDSPEPRARVLVLAGALMGGEIEKAVREIREQGVLVRGYFFPPERPQALRMRCSSGWPTSIHRSITPVSAFF